MSEPAPNMLKRLRDAALLTRDEMQRFHLKTMADGLQAALDALHNDATQEAMIAVNGLWVRAVWLLERTDDGKDLPPRGGAMREERYAKAA